MTCVAGVIKNGIVTMGCDLLVTSSDGDVMSKNKKKIFRVGPCLIGFCGPARVAELLQYKLDLSKYWTLSGYQYVCKELVPKLRELLLCEGLYRRGDHSRGQGLRGGPYLSQPADVGDHFGNHRQRAHR